MFKFVKIIVMKLSFAFLLFFASIMFYSQNIFTRYPKGQYSYLGGDKEFYKDFHKILIEKALAPCNNQKEYFNAKILVESETSAKLIHSDSLNAQNSKCAYDLTMKVISYMDKWIPFKIDGKIQPAVDSYFIYPNDLFENYKEGYGFETIYQNAKYNNEANGGVQSFRNDISKRCDISNFYFRGKGILRVETSFVINAEGKLEDLQIVKSSGLQQFDQMILDAIKGASINKWTPAKVHNTPVKVGFKMPFSVNVN